MQFSYWQFCNTIAQFIFTDSIFVKIVLLIGWESRKVPLMEEKSSNGQWTKIKLIESNVKKVLLGILKKYNFLWWY